MTLDAGAYACVPAPSLRVDTVAPILRLFRAGSWLSASVGALMAPGVARGSFLSGDALDSFASFLAVFILIVVPIAAVVLFWLVHILPEKIAERRHHPQQDAIKTLCLLSLVFGGLLWPLAWLWAYTRPALYRMAYGTDKHESYYRELAEKEGRHAGMLAEDVAVMRRDLATLAQRGAGPAELASMQERLAILESRLIAVSEEPKG
jgi:CBS domain containing-hemolysin-like protein